MRISDWSSDVCSSDLHREPGNRPARQTPPGARPNRDLMTLPASGPGRLLERSGDAATRGMTVQDRTRLIGRISPKNRRTRSPEAQRTPTRLRGDPHTDRKRHEKGYRVSVRDTLGESKKTQKKNNT